MYFSKSPLTIMVMLLYHMVEVKSVIDSDGIHIKSDLKTNLSHHKQKKRYTPIMDSKEHIKKIYNYTAILKHRNEHLKSNDSLQFIVPSLKKLLPHQVSGETEIIKDVDNIDNTYHKEEYLKPHVESVEMLDNNFAIASSSDADFRIWRAPHSTFGQPWPIPLHWRPTEALLTVNLNNFTFKCDKGNHIISEAFIRYRRLIFEERTAASYYIWPHQQHRLAEKLVGTISGLDVIILKSSASKPHLQMDESYKLLVGSNEHVRALLIANETWGALRGLESFSQILWQTEDNTLYVNNTLIVDKPRFPHRGLLVDTARHFVRKETLLRNLDAMAYNKLNVFHWHLIDDQSFPFQSRTFPNLSRLGAFDPQHSVYTYDDIREIVEHARLRGIRVIPELDSPGHTHGLSYAFPHVMTRCYDNGFWNGFFGPVNPAVPALFDLLKGLFAEMVELFPDEFVHLGADEVPLKCWESNPDVQQLKDRLKIEQPELIMDYYMRKLQNVVTQMGLRNATKRRRFVVWQEAHDNGLLLKKGTLIQVWKGDSSFSVHQIARAGLPVIYSACWYLDRLEYGPQWVKFYECEPGTSQDTHYEKWQDNILGGEACMWMEYQSDLTVISRIWPLTSAVAERLWSSTELLNVAQAAPRLEEQRCRMLQRGIEAGVASGPGSCSHHRKRVPVHVDVRSNSDSTMYEHSNVVRFALLRKQSKKGAHLKIYFFFLGCFLLLVLLITQLKFGSISCLRNLLGWLLFPRRLMALLSTLLFVYFVVWLIPLTLHFA